VIVLKNSKVDPSQAEAAIVANIDRSRQQRAGKKTKAIQNHQMEFSGNGFNTETKMITPGGGFNTDSNQGLPSLTEARRNRELIKIQQDLIELKERKGELVSKTAATEWLSLIITNAKSHLWGLPKRLSDSLFIKFMKLLKDEICLLPLETQQLLEPVISNLKFDSKIIEQELRHPIRQVLHEMGTRLQETEKGIKKKHAKVG
jgi:hypothetical protein